MATNPLQAALKPIVSMEPTQADDPYNLAMQQLMQKLEARQNRGSSNTLLAIAEGLLTPTATGSFGESIGQVAKSVRGVQAQQEKEEMDVAQMRLQLAQAQRDQARKQKGMEMLSNRADGETTSPTLNVRGQPMNPAKIAAIKYQDKELGDALETEYKLMLDSVTTQPGGSFNKITNEYKPFGGKTTVERFVPGDPKAGRQAMTVPMSEADAIEFDQARTKGDAKTYWDIVERNTTSLTKPTQEAPKISASNLQPSGEVKIAQTPAELKRQQDVEDERNKTIARKGAESEQARTDSILDAAKSARGLSVTYTRAQEILKTPGIEKVMGLVNQGDILSGIANLAGEAFRVGQATVGIPAIEKVLTDSGVPQNLLDKALELGQLEAMWQMEMRKGLGAGTSISNMEQMMANRVVPSQKDPINAYKQKLAFLQEKAKFEVQLGRELKRTNLSYDKFEDTDEFNKMFTNYQNSLMNIVSPRSALTGTPKGAAPSTGPITPSMLRERLGLKP